MKTFNSISGGKSSAYIAANYPADFNVFALVCIDDPKCSIKDKKLIQKVNDRLEETHTLQDWGEFIATAEDDIIIKTIFDLEQLIGKRINWVRGESFDSVVETKSGWLPNKLHRYCTTEMKIRPLFTYWLRYIYEPIESRIGFRANEIYRAMNMMNKTNDNGLLEFKFPLYTRIKSKYSKNFQYEWQRPFFPLIEDGIYKDHIEKFWEDKPVEFAMLNNCVGCFHRNPILLKKMHNHHPKKIEWFADKEGGRNGYWRSDIPYAKIIKHKTQLELTFSDFSECDSGYCGL